MSAIPDPTRPSLASARRQGWRQFLLGEWGLILLAAALSVIIWLIVRQKVLKEYEIRGVEVRLRVEEKYRDKVAAVLTGDSSKVTLKLNCSEREREQVIEQLKRDGWGVDVLVREIPAAAKRPLDPLNDRYQWKFAAERILLGVAPEIPKGSVLRIASRKAKVEMPATVPSPEALRRDQFLQATIEVTPPVIDVSLPVGTPDEPIVPDPIDLRKILDQTGRAVSLTLSFENWRNEAKLEPDVAAYRRQIALPPVTAQVRLEEVGEERITNDLYFILDPVKYETNLNRQKLEGVSQAGALTFTGLLRGPKAVLAELKRDAEEKRGNWIWAVRLKDRAFPPKPPEGQEPEWKKMSAEIVWVPLKGFSDRGIRFVPAPPQDGFDLDVRWHVEHDR